MSDAAVNMAALAAAAAAGAGLLAVGGMCLMHRENKREREYRCGRLQPHQPQAAVELLP